jgi:hypothetical protein
VAVVYDKRGPDTTGMEAYLKTQAVAAHRYALRDLDGLNCDVCAGRVNRVIFVRVQDFLEGIFNDEIKYARWQAAEVQVDFVESPEPDASAHLAALGRAWEKHCRARRRRQTVAGLILGTIAVAAAYVVVQF